MKEEMNVLLKFKFKNDLILKNTLNKTKWNNLFKQYWKIIKL